MLDRSAEELIKELFSNGRLVNNFVSGLKTFY